MVNPRVPVYVQLRTGVSRARKAIIKATDISDEFRIYHSHYRILYIIIYANSCELFLDQNR